MNEADKRRAVMTLLRDEEWGNQKRGWSNKRVAEVCKVSDVLVAALRSDLAREMEQQVFAPPSDEPVVPKQPGMREGRDGKAYGAPGTSKAPGAARKRVVETVVEVPS